MNHTNIRHTIALAFVCFLSTAAKGQDNFVPAVVVLSNGDTLHGYVDDKNWHITPDKIHYRAGLEGTITEYTAGELQSFDFGTEDRYVSNYAVLHYYTDKISELEEQMDTITRRGPLIFQVLYSGAASLLMYVDDQLHKHYFIQKDSGQPEELILKRFIGKMRNPGINASAQPAIATMDKYKQMLSYYFSDCPSLLSKIEKCSYTGKALTRLFEEYSRCKNVAGAELQPKDQQLTFSLGAIAGLTATTVNLKSDVAYAYVKPLAHPDDYSTSLDPAFGVRMFIALPRKNRMRSIVNDILWTHYKVQGSEAYGSGTITSIFDMTYLNLHTLFQYDFSNRETRPYGKIGMGNSWALEHEATSKVESVNGFDGTSPDYRFVTIRTHETSLLLALGVRNRKFQADITWKWGNGFSSVSTIHVPTHSWMLLVAYIF